MGANRTSMEEAIKIIKQTFGNDVDFSPGTSGYAMAKMIEMHMEEIATLRAKLEALTATP